MTIFKRTISLILAMAIVSAAWGLTALAIGHLFNVEWLQDSANVFCIGFSAGLGGLIVSLFGPYFKKSSNA